MHVSFLLTVHCSRRVVMQDMFCEVMVAEDGSFLTEFCSLRCR